jgi:hypothetical protein
MLLSLKYLKKNFFFREPTFPVKGQRIIILSFAGHRSAPQLFICALVCIPKAAMGSE